PQEDGLFAVSDLEGVAHGSRNPGCVTDYLHQLAYAGNGLGQHRREQLGVRRKKSSDFLGTRSGLECNPEWMFCHVNLSSAPGVIPHVSWQLSRIQRYQPVAEDPQRRKRAIRNRPLEQQAVLIVSE